MTAPGGICIEPWTRASATSQRERWLLPLAGSQRAALAGDPAARAPVFHAIAAACARSVFRGFGFLIVQGFVSAADSVAVAEERLRALGRCIGKEMPQSPDGALVGVLTDRPGSDWRAEQPMHTDGGDTLALLCLNPAARGGISRLASGLAAYRALAATDPGAIDLLRREWHFDRRGRPGPPTLRKRIFEWVDGELHVFHLPGTVRRTPAVHGLPPLGPAETAALAHLDALFLSPELLLEWPLATGDLLILDNRAVVHARSGYDDAPGAPPRLLLRMWWAVDRPAWRALLA